MVTKSEQRGDSRSDCSHAGAKRNRFIALFYKIYLLVELSDRGIDLPYVRVAIFLPEIHKPSLLHRRQRKKPNDEWVNESTRVFLLFYVFHTKSQK